MLRLKEEDLCEGGQISILLVSDQCLWQHQTPPGLCQVSDLRIVEDIVSSLRTIIIIFLHIKGAQFVLIINHLYIHLLLFALAELLHILEDIVAYSVDRSSIAHCVID